MLDISEGIHDIGTIRWELASCLLLAWSLVYLALWRGIKSIGKVVLMSMEAAIFLPHFRGPIPLTDSLPHVTAGLLHGAVPLLHPGDPPGARRHAAGLHGRHHVLSDAPVAQTGGHQCEYKHLSSRHTWL